MVIIDYIQKNIGSKLTIEILSKEHSRSPNSIYRLFKKRLGMSPGSYLKKTRIDKACDFLLHTHMSIEIIAEKCGFCDRNHLTKIFRSEKGVTPSVYRKNSTYY